VCQQGRRWQLAAKPASEAMKGENKHTPLADNKLSADKPNMNGEKGQNEGERNKKRFYGPLLFRATHLNANQP